MTQAFTGLRIAIRNKYKALLHNAACYVCGLQERNSRALSAHYTAKATKLRKLQSAVRAERDLIITQLESWIIDIGKEIAQAELNVRLQPKGVQPISAAAFLQVSVPKTRGRKKSLAAAREAYIKRFENVYTGKNLQDFADAVNAGEFDNRFDV